MSCILLAQREFYTQSSPNQVSTNFMNGKIYTFNTTKFQMVDGNIKPFNEVE